MKRRFFFAILFVLAAIYLPSVHAQNAVSGGSISGEVTDNSGAAVVGADALLTNTGTGVETKTITNDAGAYRFPVLGVGSYSLEITKAGFKKAEIKNIVVSVGQDSAVNVTLQVGAVSESVTVSAAGPLLRTTDSSTSTVVNDKLIEGLPLSGRRYTDFVLLTPNVNADGQFGLVSVGGQQGGGDSGYANGNGSNSFTLDGANATSSFFGDARGRTRVPYVFGEQSIQEFQVADNPYDASYGSAGSGFINTVTKSGTEMFHGDAFYYLRNSGTGADDAIDHANGIKTPLNVLQQFGADLGGPVIHNKAWFYFDWEQQRQLEPISVINPGVSAITETSFQNIAPGTTLPAPNGPFPVPASFSSAPLPSDPNYPVYLQQVSNALHLFQSNVGPRARRRDDISFFPKLDWQPTQADRFTFAYNYNRFNSPGGTITFNPVSSEGDSALPNNYVRDHHATIHYTHTFSPTLLNDLHASFLRDEQIGTPSGLVNPSFPGVQFLFGGFFQVGNPTFSIADTKEFQWELGEQLNYVRGKHSLKFGFDFNRSHVTDFSPGNFLGTYSFFSLDPTNFALGNFSRFTQTTGNPYFLFTVPYYGFYVQDKFQATHKLTLDLGLREDFQVYPQPTVNPAFPPTGQFPNQYQRLSPRLGFAYQIADKTVVRGGFGLFYEVFNGINYENSVSSNGLASHQSSIFVPFNPALPPNQQSPAFPSRLSNTSSFGASSNISLIDPNFQTPQIQEASLEIQREILHDTTLTIGTMWTHGIHLIGSSAYDMNLIPPVGTTTYTVCPGGFNGVGCIGNPGLTYTGPNLDGGLLNEGRISSQFGQINALISPGSDRYNSLYVQLQRRVATGLQMMVSYTYAKTMQHAVDFNNQFDFSNTTGPSLLDQRHRLSIASIYAPDASHISNAFSRTLLSNWSISTVMAFNSGRPYTATLAAACTGVSLATCNGSNDTVNNVVANEGTNNTAAGFNGSAPSFTQGIDSFYGPWIEEVDLGIARAFHVTERHIVTFRVQAFNLLNHPNFYVQNGSGVNPTQYDPIGSTCGDSHSTTQQCFLTPDPGFGTLTSIGQLNGPRVFQFSLTWSF